MRNSHKIIRISVICPVFNSSIFIKKTLNCLLNQLERPYEVIFCDDGSIDNSYDIILSYKIKFEKLKIKFLLIKTRHRGVSFARNLCIKRSTAEWISFLDSDDLWKKNKLKVIIDNIKSNPKKNFFIHWEYKKNTNGSLCSLKHANFLTNSENLTKELYKRNFFSTSAVTCKKKIIKKVSYFDEALTSTQDYDLWLKMSPFIKLQVIKIFLGYYIDRKDNISSNFYFKKCLFLLKIAFRYRVHVNYKIFILKIIKIFFSLNWFRFYFFKKYL